MSKVLVSDTYLSNIATAIRNKNGQTSATYTPAQMAPAITALTPNLQAKTGINATTTTVTVTADTGYTGLGTVTVNGITNTYAGSSVPAGEMLVNGPTVTATAGYKLYY